MVVDSNRGDAASAGRVNHFDGRHRNRAVYLHAVLKLRKTKLLGRLVLVFISLLITFVIIEIFYRAYVRVYRPVITETPDGYRFNLSSS